MANKIILAILGLSLALATPAWAFDGNEAFQDQLLNLKRSQLGPTLGADQRTVDQLLAIEQRYGAMKQQLNRDAMGALRQLQQVMQSPQPREEDVRLILETMLRKKKEIEELRQRQWDEEKALLTPSQQARYMLYSMKILREARSVRAPAAPKPPVGKAPGSIPAFRPER